jgi:hypothetical protein
VLIFNRKHGGTLFTKNDYLQLQCLQKLPNFTANQFGCIEWCGRVDLLVRWLSLLKIDFSLLLNWILWFVFLFEINIILYFSFSFFENLNYWLFTFSSFVCCPHFI